MGKIKRPASRESHTCGAGDILASYGWGVIWAVYRDGRREGFEAFANPIYGFTRGVGSFWEEPRWKEAWNYNVESFAVSMLASEEYKLSGGIDEKRKGLVNWVKELPEDERAKLMAGLTVFADTATELMALNHNSFIEDGELLPPDSRKVADLKKRISSEVGLGRAWTVLDIAIKKQYVGKQPLSQEMFDGKSQETLEDAKRILLDEGRVHFDGYHKRMMDWTNGIFEDARE